MITKSLHIGSGLFIPDSMLKEAGIDDEEVEIEILQNQIKITPKKNAITQEPGVITPDSEFWNLVGVMKTPGVHGRDHDQYLYNIQ